MLMYIHIIGAHAKCTVYCNFMSVGTLRICYIKFQFEFNRYWISYMFRNQTLHRLRLLWQGIQQFSQVRLTGRITDNIQEYIISYTSLCTVYIWEYGNVYIQVSFKFPISLKIKFLEKPNASFLYIRFPSDAKINQSIINIYIDSIRLCSKYDYFYPSSFVGIGRCKGLSFKRQLSLVAKLQQYTQNIYIYIRVYRNMYEVYIERRALKYMYVYILTQSKQQTYNIYGLLMSCVYCVCAFVQ